MQRVVDAALSLVPTADGAVIELASGATLTYVCAAGEMIDHIGLSWPLHDGLSGLAIRTGQVLISNDSSVDQRVDIDTCRRVKTTSLICVPLRRKDEIIGVLELKSSVPHAFSRSDVSTLMELAEFITWTVAGVTDLARFALDQKRKRVAEFVSNVLQPGMVASIETRERIDSLLGGGPFTIHLQPVVDLESNELVGAEALARFPDHLGKPPDCWFADAHKVGKGTELELASIQCALRLLDQLPGDSYLAVNAGPDVVWRADILHLLEGLDCSRVVIELTEHFAVKDYPTLSERLFELRKLGARIAVDDTGTGFSTLAHILEVAPDIIKLDRTLTTGIDLDPVRRALASSLTVFASSTGATVVAEGIETEEELVAIRDLGIRYGQGFYLGRPGPAELLGRFATSHSSLSS